MEVVLLETPMHEVHRDLNLERNCLEALAVPAVLHGQRTTVYCNPHVEARHFQILDHTHCLRI